MESASDTKHGGTGSGGGGDSGGEDSDSERRAQTHAVVTAADVARLVPVHPLSLATWEERGHELDLMARFMPKHLARRSQSARLVHLPGSSAAPAIVRQDMTLTDAPLSTAGAPWTVNHDLNRKVVLCAGVSKGDVLQVAADAIVVPAAGKDGLLT